MLVAGIALATNLRVAHIAGALGAGLEVIAGLMLITAIGAPELAFVGGSLFLVFVTFLVTLVKTRAADATDESGEEDEHEEHPGVPTTYPGVAFLLTVGVGGSFLGGHAMSDVGDFIVASFPSLAPMMVALILALIAGVPTYVIVGNAQTKKQPLIALSNTFGGLTQNLFNVMAVCCLMIAIFNWVGILDHTTIPSDLRTTLAVLFIYPTYSILSRAIGQVRLDRDRLDDRALRVLDVRPDT